MLLYALEGKEAVMISARGADQESDEVGGAWRAGGGGVCGGAAAVGVDEIFTGRGVDENLKGRGGRKWKNSGERRKLCIGGIGNRECMLLYIFQLSWQCPCCLTICFS